MQVELTHNQGRWQRFKDFFERNKPPIVFIYFFSLVIFIASSSGFMGRGPKYANPVCGCECSQFLGQRRQILRSANSQIHFNAGVRLSSSEEYIPFMEGKVVEKQDMIYFAEDVDFAMGILQRVPCSVYGAQNWKEFVLKLAAGFSLSEDLKECSSSFAFFNHDLFYYAFPLPTIHICKSNYSRNWLPAIIVHEAAHALLPVIIEGLTKPQMRELSAFSMHKAFLIDLKRFLDSTPESELEFELIELKKSLPGQMNDMDAAFYAVLNGSYSDGK